MEYYAGIDVSLELSQAEAVSPGGHTLRSNYLAIVTIAAIALWLR